MNSLADAGLPAAAPLAPRYGATAKLLHWGAAAVLVTAAGESRHAGRMDWGGY